MKKKKKKIVVSCDAVLLYSLLLPGPALRIAQAFQPLRNQFSNFEQLHISQLLAAGWYLVPGTVGATLLLPVSVIVRAGCQVAPQGGGGDWAHIRSPIGAKTSHIFASQHDQVGSNFSWERFCCFCCLLHRRRGIGVPGSRSREGGDWACVR